MAADPRTHFTAAVFQRLIRDEEINHYMTIAYCLWVNGTVERVCRDVLRSERALLSEWRLVRRRCPTVIECIQAIQNLSPTERLGSHAGYTEIGLSSLEVFTGMKPRCFQVRPLPTLKYTSISHLEDERAETLIDVDCVQISLREMHTRVAEKNYHRRMKSRRVQNAKTKVLP